MSSDSEEAEVIVAEQARCDAWSGEGIERLEDLLSDDIWYVHTSGKRDDKVGLFEVAKGGFRVVRENLEVQVLGDVAIMTGTIIISPLAPEDPVNPPTWVSLGLQVWRKTDGRWQLIAQQSTPVPAA
jgi:ketosteroid isomerase-like protein